MSYDLAGKHVLVTGASTGIGEGLALGFAQRGATVGICARRSDLLDQVLARCREHAPDSRAWTVDLAELDGLADFAKRASDELGGIDVLVNNAGMPKRKKIFDIDVATIEYVMRLNYFSPVRLTMALLPEIVERGGRFVYLSSVAARLAPPGEGAYGASKAAISAFAESLQVDLRNTDVRVHLVYPGVIDTELFRIPDNEPLVAAIEALPVEALVGPVLEMIENDGFEVAVPDWFGDIFAGKYKDVGAFMEGTMAYARSQDATEPA